MTRYNFVIKLILLSAALGLAAASCNRTMTPSSLAEIKIGNASVKAEVADTQALREQGLSGRALLPSDSGMLFVFEQEKRAPFWMKGMNFPLDFVWIRDGRVVEITPDVSHELPPGTSTHPLIYPSGPIDAMLEVNAGWAKAAGIRVGDPVDVIR